MNKLKVASKRVRPLMGTFVEVTLFSEGNFDSLITKAFEKASELEKVFNVHDPKSDISILNNTSDDDTFELHPALAEVLEAADEIMLLSEGAFSPYREDSAFWDLSGIAKGYIVDQMVETILAEQPALMGMVNAGGDLRFFNCPEKKISLRLGSASHPLERSLMLLKDAIATSSPTVAMTDEKSSTIYLKPLREGLSVQHAVSVIADTCMIADAMTKVGLFAKKEIVQKCASTFKAQVIIFGADGDPLEVFENHEAQ